MLQDGLHSQNRGEPVLEQGKINLEDLTNPSSTRRYSPKITRPKSHFRWSLATIQAAATSNSILRHLVSTCIDHATTFLASTHAESLKRLYSLSWSRSCQEWHLKRSQCGHRLAGARMASANFPKRACLTVCPRRIVQYQRPVIHEA